MLDSKPIYPFNFCKIILGKNTKKRDLVSRKGDLIDVPEHDHESNSINELYQSSNNLIKYSERAMSNCSFQDLRVSYELQCNIY